MRKHANKEENQDGQSQLSNGRKPLRLAVANVSMDSWSPITNWVIESIHLHTGNSQI